MDTWRRLAFAAIVAFMFSNAVQAQVTAPTTEPPTDGALLPEPKPIQKSIELFNEWTTPKGEPKDGFSITLGDIITGAGFVAVGPAYQHRLFKDRAVLKSSAAVSVKLYWTAEGGIEFPHLAKEHLRIGAHTLYQDALQVNWFGLGNNSSPDNRSGYRLTTNDLTGYGIIGSPDLFLTARVGWLAPVNVSRMAGRRPNYPDTVQAFAEASAPGISQRPGFLHGEVALTADTRDHSGHPTDGGLYQAAWTVFSDRGRGTSSFQRYELEAAQFIRLLNSWTLALHGSIAGTLTGAGQTIPFYFMPSLGGKNLRAYADYRFHDRAMQAYSVESRWALFRHLDAAIFMDLGSVAPEIARLNLSDLKPSWGAGIRLHNDRSTIGRLDVAYGAEGWRVMFKMSDPFQRSSQTGAKRPPVVPFVP